MLRKGLSTCRALATALLASASASADVPRPVHLDYERQEGAAACPDDAAIRAGVAARLGYEPFREKANDHLRATIRQIGHVLEARIELVDAQGNIKAERRLISRNHDCAELASSVELAIAIAIDPVISTPPPSEEPPPASGASEATAPGEPRGGNPAKGKSAAPAVGSSSAWPSIGKRVEAGVLGGIGWAPAASLGFRAGAGLQSGPFSLGVEARADLPSSTPLRVGEATASLLVASLVPCGHVRMAAACLLATAGVERVAGHGLLDSRRATPPYLGFGARLALVLPITARVSLAVHSDVTAPVTQTKLTVDDSVVWTTPQVALALGIGVAFRSP